MANEKSAGKSSANLESSTSVHEPSRVLALSDGVVAIAITVLVLPLADIDLPQEVLSGGNFLGYIWATYSQLILSFLISWLVIISYWFDHHRLFDKLKYVDGFIVKVNMVWLLAIVIMPFPTNLLSQDKNGPPGAAASLYLLVLFFTSSSLCLIEFYADRHAELRNPAKPWYKNSWLFGLASSAYILLLAVVAPFLGGATLWGLIGLFVIGTGMRRAHIGMVQANPEVSESSIEEL